MKKKIVYAIEGIQQISVIIIFLLLYSCASIKPVKPNLPTTRIVVPEPEKSRLKIPITINVNALVNRLDSNILRSIDNKDKWECEGNNCIEYKIDMDDLGVTINGNILSVNTKLKYQVSYGRKLFGKIQSLASSGEQTLNVGFNSGLTWNNDWTLSTKTSLIPVTGSDVYISEFNYNVTRVIISGLQHS